MNARTLYECMAFEQMRAEDTNEPVHFTIEADGNQMAQGFLYPDGGISMNLMGPVYVRLFFNTLSLEDEYIYLYFKMQGHTDYVGMIACGEITNFKVD